MEYGTLRPSRHYVFPGHGCAVKKPWSMTLCGHHGITSVVPPAQLKSRGMRHSAAITGLRVPAVPDAQFKIRGMRHSAAIAGLRVPAVPPAQLKRRENTVFCARDCAFLWPLLHSVKAVKYRTLRPSRDYAGGPSCAVKKPWNTTFYGHRGIAPAVPPAQLKSRGMRHSAATQNYDFLRFLPHS